jgi:superkiller protein 3
VSDPTRRSVALAHDRVGESLLSLNRPQEAAERFERSVQIDPTLATAWLHLAAVRDRQEQPLAAIAAYERYLRLVPNDAVVLTWLGQLYGRIGRFRDAAAAFTRALEVDPDHAAAKQGLTMALAMQRRAATQTTRPAGVPDKRGYTWRSTCPSRSP